jgi:hypothetical protein
MYNKKVMAMFCMFLIVGLPFSSFSVGAQGADEESVGEAVTVNVDGYSPVTISSDYLQNKDFPVHAHLTGTTLGNFLFGASQDSSLDSAPLYQGIKIDKVIISLKNSSNQYLHGSPTYVRPQNNEYIMSSDGSFDLGNVIITLKKNKNESSLPDVIDIDMSARIFFDTESGFGGMFGIQDIGLKQFSNEQDWLASSHAQSDSRFWGGKGYLRLIEMGEKHVIVSIYDGSHRSVVSNMRLDMNKEANVFSLPGSSSIFGDKSRIKLKSLVSSQTSANLLVKKGNDEPYEISLYEGMRVFPGSEWSIKSIIPAEGSGEGSVILTDDARNTITLNSSEAGGDGCLGVELLDDSVFDLEIEELNYEDSNKAYCTAIEEYKKSENFLLSTNQSGDNKNLLIEVYGKLIEAYTRVGSSLLAAEYIEKKAKLDGNSDINYWSSYLKQSNFAVSLRGGIVSLHSITTEDQKKSVSLKINNKDYIEYNVTNILDGISDGFKWMINDISENRITIVKQSKAGESEKYSSKGLKVGRNEIDGNIIFVKDINTYRRAVITVLPGSGRAFSESDFSIHLPIEKRAIQWTPEEIDKKIASTTKKVEKLDSITSKLDSVIKGWKVACFSTFAILVVKNSFFQTPDARRLVMRDWNKLCADEVKQAKEEGDVTYDMSACYKEHREDIETQVKASQIAVKTVKKSMEEYKGIDKEGSSKIISDAIDGEISEEQFERLAKYGDLSSEDARDLVYYFHYNKTVFDSKVEKLSKDDELYDDIDKSIKGEWDTKEKEIYIQSMLHDTKKSVSLTGEDSDDAARTYLTEEGYDINRVVPLSKLEGKSNNFYGYNNGEKYEGLTPVLNNDNPVIINGKTVYSKNDSLFLVAQDPRGGISYSPDFMGKPTVHYNDKQKPTLIPFKLRAGIFENSEKANYLYVDYSNDIPIFSVWNVGSDGKIGPFIEGKKNDDVLIMDHQKLNKDNRARNDIEKIYNTANVKVSDGKKVPGMAYVANIAIQQTGTSLMQCMDFMSFDDCKVLFNVCDPVMCPSSRFNLGGTWHVDSVVQTGIIGSLFLGWGNGDYLPICLTGILAGLQNIKSLFQGYNECLNTAKVSGESVGICNVIRSVYICELIWKEALAFFSVNGKITKFIMGKIFKNTGGGEFLNWQSSWTNLKNSVSFFTKDYATSAFASYTSRSTDELGSELCKAAIFAKTPGVGDFFSRLTEAESPVQFTAWFDELEYTASAIGSDNSKSIYRVYYHIYAGESQDVRYSVYLKGPEKYNLYVTNPESSQSRGFIKAGSYADNSFTITGDSGYREICVEYNGRTECGFGKSTSAFALDYANDFIVKDEFNRDIKSAKDCQPDSPRVGPSMGSIITPVNYGLLNTGIVRVCSVTNPGAGMSEGQWEVVGSCGVDELGRSMGNCWIDTETFKLNDLNRDSILADRIQNVADDIISEGAVLDASAALEILKTVETLYPLTSDQVKQIRDVIYYSTDAYVNAKAHKMIGDVYFGYGVLFSPSIPPEENDENVGSSTGESYDCTIKYDFDYPISFVTWSMFMNNKELPEFKFSNGAWLWRWPGLYKVSNVESGNDILSNCGISGTVIDGYYVGYDSFKSVSDVEKLTCVKDEIDNEKYKSEIQHLHTTISDLNDKNYTAGFQILYDALETGRDNDDQLIVYKSDGKKCQSKAYDSSGTTYVLGQLKGCCELKDMDHKDNNNIVMKEGISYANLELNKSEIQEISIKINEKFQNEAKCAGALSIYFDEKYLTDKWGGVSSCGVKGDAWEMAKNVLNKDGEYVFKDKKVSSTDNINSLIESGDILGIYYEGSNYKNQAEAELGSYYYTHVGLVVGKTDSGEPIIVHYLNNQLIFEPINNLINEEDYALVAGFRTSNSCVA